MFGYIRAEKGELKIKEYDTYKAVYCSLCRRLGKNYGILSRLTLSYDFTFLTMLNMSLKEGCPKYEKKRCRVNPFKKCMYCADEQAFDMPSAAAMIMLYYKILDNIKDEKGLKRLFFKLIKPMFSRAHKKAKALYPDIESAVYEYISEQNEIESKSDISIDEACEPTAKVMADILSFCSDDASQKRVLNRLGYCIGRYIYLLDAAADIKKDIESGAYNCLKAEYDKSGNINSRVVPQLYVCVNEAAKAFELLDIKKYKSILGNIIYIGLESTFLKELNE